MATILKEPEKRFDMPIWCHHNGARMHLTQFDKGKHYLMIANEEGESIKITPQNQKEDEWKVEWRINEYFDIVVFKSSELKTAFGLSNDPGKTGFQIIQEFGAHSAEENKYIRYGDFLNIPHANTENARYISIYIDDEIRNAISKLLPF